MASVLLFTGNLVVALYVSLNILFVVCVLLGFLLYVLRYEFGAVEAVGATIFVGMSVDYCLRLAHGYNVAFGVDREAKMKAALVHLGPSIVGGAVTTLAGTAFLLPCRILLFVKLGAMLFTNALISLLYTFFFLSPLLMVIGPTKETGNIWDLIKCGPLRRSVEWDDDDDDDAVPSKILLRGP